MDAKVKEPFPVSVDVADDTFRWLTHQFSEQQHPTPLKLKWFKGK